MKNAVRIVGLTVKHWRQDNCALLAAGLAYYTTISLVPLLALGLAIAGRVMGQAATMGRLDAVLQNFVGTMIAGSIEALIAGVSKGALAQATVLSLAALLWVASIVFLHLERALNIVWESKPRRGVRGFFVSRLLAFGMVAGVGLLFIILAFINAILGFLRGFLDPIMPFLEQVPIWSGVNLAVLFLVLWGLWTVVYKMLPSLKLKWEDVSVGGFVTSFLITLGVYFLGFYFSRVEYRSIFGAAASIMVVLIWIYFSCQIFLLGAEFTWAWAHRHPLLSGGVRKGERPGTSLPARPSRS
jgi:membrane protein